MSIEIIVPPLSQTMDSLILVEWLKNIGDPIEKGENLFRVETDKATLEVESPASGYLEEILAQPGSEIKIRSIIGKISTEPVSNVQTAIDQPQWTGPNGEPLPPERLNRIFASPRARGLAEKEGVDLSKITPSGPQAMIVERDVRAFLDQQRHLPRITPVAKRVAEEAGLDIAAIKEQSLPAQVIRRADVESIIQEAAKTTKPAAETPAIPKTTQPLTATRKTIAKRMLESHQTTAPFTLTREVDATALVSLREQILAELTEKDPRPTYTDFLISITARSLLNYPTLNATYTGEMLELSDDVNLSLAVDTDRGLLTPVMRSVQNKRLLEITRERQQIVSRTLEGSLTPSDLSGGTFTLTNLGTMGIDVFTPILNIPQVAILGIGRIRSVPAVFQNQVTIRQVMILSLTVDHRFVDGAPAARFLSAVAARIEKPHLSWL